ncbi:hypothetical protein PBY51_019801 [Eleginops maclovinus]|uniref:Ig-like domain-containing protein n=1 Tax=Eleginops maclovinus TaxID=56733 RepID=A0AAN7XR65_ELEMC|nr:hypothetical protein PBY51_019801 [Eleginops maclovinus]
MSTPRDENCAEKPEFTQSSLVVQFGKPTSALCSLSSFHNIFDIESPIGVRKRNGTTVSWTVNSMTEWNIRLSCYYTNDTTDEQCFSILPITVYKPPDNVSISFVNHAGPLSAGQQYTLQCDVQDVAPVKNLTVTFYRGQTVLGELKSNKDQKKPVSEVFTLNITSTKEDNGLQFWCEAKLELGAEGPQQPPVVESEKLNATVLYKPQRLASYPSDPIIITEGNPLQLNCSSVGNPPPSYAWKTPPGLPPSSNGSIFFITSTTPENEGSYNCSVINDKGSLFVTFNVKVRAPELPSTSLPTTTTSTPTTAMTTTTTTTTTAPNRGTCSKLLHSFIMGFLLLFSALV